MPRGFLLTDQFDPQLPIEEAMKFTKIMITALAASLVLTACGKEEKAAEAPAAQAEVSSIKARQDLMQDWRGANEAMKGMLENPASFDAAAFKERAELISNSTANMWKHFEGEANKGGESQDAVWTDAAAFKAEADKFSAAAADLVAAASTAQSAADVEAQFGAMAGTCGSCHKVFKK